MAIRDACQPWARRQGDGKAWRAGWMGSDSRPGGYLHVLDCDTGRPAAAAAQRLVTRARTRPGRGCCTSNWDARSRDHGQHMGQEPRLVPRLLVQGGLRSIVSRPLCWDGP